MQPVLLLFWLPGDLKFNVVVVQGTGGMKRKASNTTLGFFFGGGWTLSGGGYCQPLLTMVLVWNSKDLSIQPSKMRGVASTAATQPLRTDLISLFIDRRPLRRIIEIKKDVLAAFRLQREAEKGRLGGEQSHSRTGKIVCSKK